MTTRDDLERVGAEALRWTRAGMDAGSRVPGLYDTAGEDYLFLARAVLDAVLASRDADGNRMVILASELEQAGEQVTTRGISGTEYVEVMRTGTPATLPRVAEVERVPVFVFRPPSGEAE